MEELDASEAAATPDPDAWDQEPPDEHLTPAFWDDPEPDFHGMLSSDRIRAYHYAVGRMIRPFQEEFLKPASYELTLGPRVLLDGKIRYLTDQKPLLEIPPNSIAFVSMREMLLLPHWLAARFDLAIRFIYKGLLLGTGPQVDPGFKGVLSCPLHNISNQPIILEYCKPFAKIDFTKTSFARPPLPPLEDEDQLYALAQREELDGYEGKPRILWTRDKNFRQPILFAEDVTLVKSSLLKLRRRVDRSRKRVKEFERRLRKGEIGVAIGIVALAIGLGGFLLNYVNGRIDDTQSRPELQRIHREVVVLDHKLNEAEAKEQELKRRISQLEGANPSP